MEEKNHLKKEKNKKNDLTFKTNIAFSFTENIYWRLAMVSFSVPVKHGGSRFQFRFAVQKLGVLFAGSRHQEVPQSMCKALIQGLAGDGFSFWVGCANGVDRSFRKSLSESAFTDRVFVGCAFRGSRLVFRAALDQLKPVFVICSSCPKGSDHYRVIVSYLYGAQGFWVVPHTISDGGPCDEEF